MSIICDYHIHTSLCKHAVGTPEEYLHTAYKQGLKVVGFSDHCPVPIGFDPESRMDFEQFEEYVEIVNELKNNSYGIEVLFGMEVDWVPGRMDEVYKFLNTIDYDYLIGSVHCINNIPFDNSDNIYLWDTPQKVKNIWNTYIDMMTDMVSIGKFDVIGHMDLPKKYKFYPEDMSYFMDKADIFFSKASKFDVAVELNTAGLRKPVKEIYPSLELLRIAKRNGVKITFGSDSHAPEQVGKNFDNARELAVAAGYCDYVCIRKNGKKDIIKL